MSMKLFENELINKIGTIVAWTIIILSILTFSRIAIRSYIRKSIQHEILQQIDIILESRKVVNLENQHGIISLIPDRKLIIINLEDKYDEFIIYLEGNHDENND